ncbi:MAG: helix-turn-helix transcriptional regulator [Pseudomonadota bacterium]
MISLKTPKQAQRSLAENSRAKRLQMDLTQQGLADRAGVSVSTLRKFEKTGEISLGSFLKLQMVLGGLDQVVAATQPDMDRFTSIDDVLKEPEKAQKQRGSRR